MLVAILATASVANAQMTIGASFTGTSNLDEAALGGWWYPPDTNGAMGPNQFVEITNESIAVYGRDGILQMRQQIASLIPPYGGGDSRIKFDPFSGRFFLTTTDFEDNFYIGVSKTSDPLDGWDFVDIDPRPGYAGYISDFPTLGITRDGLFVSFDLYQNYWDYDATALNLISIKKADLLNGTFSPSSWTSNIRTGDRWTKGSFHAVDDLTGTLTNETMLSTSWWETDAIHSSTVTLGADGYVVTDNPDIAVADYSNPPMAPQAGTSTPAQTNDSRLFGTPVYQKGCFWAVHQINVDGVSRLKWYQINALNGKVVHSGLIGSSDVAAYFGSIAVNEFGDIVIGFSGSNASEYPSIYAVQGRVDGLGRVFFAQPVCIKVGEGYNTSGRFGDYSATMIDPSNHRNFWTVQEYGTGTNGGRGWGTYIAQLQTHPGDARIMH